MNMIDRSVCMAVCGVAALGLVAAHGMGEDESIERTGSTPAAPSAETSNMAPDFTLPDTLGNEHTLSKYLADEKVVVLEWFNPTCKFDVMYHGEHSVIRDVQQEFAEKDVVWLAINSGCPESGTADAELNESTRQQWDMRYPVLLDPEGKIGRLYKAKTTPQFFVIDADGVVAYQGGFDNIRRLRYGPGDTCYLRDALALLLSNAVPERSKVRPTGCAVKYCAN